MGVIQHSTKSIQFKPQKEGKTMTLEKTLEVFKKRTHEEKQQYIYKLVRENNQLRNELKEMKLRIEDIEYDIELINKR